jgi:signal transduction histidine kinase
MSHGDNRDPQARSSTDEGLRNERKKTDIELASRSSVMRDAAAALVTEARSKADAVLSDARDREDLKQSADRSTIDRTRDRASEDAVLERARSGADVLVRDEAEQRRVALASLLAFEREFTDIRLESERVRADEALSSREDFMAMVSHDLRSLLGGIALSAELLRDVRDTDDPFAKVTQYAERIQRLSARMNRLVGDLMDVASIEAGKLGLARVRRSARLLLLDALEAFEPAARAAGIQLRCECSIDPGVVELDHERVLQVLTNLVGNALKFTSRGGWITIRLERHGDDLCFAVDDTGTGIPAEFIEKIFDRYFQTNINDRRGLGLGLFISKSIIEGHGGTIRVESTPGRGSTFFVTVPARAA